LRVSVGIAPNFPYRNIYEVVVEPNHSDMVLATSHAASTVAAWNIDALAIPGCMSQRFLMEIGSLTVLK
jgi:hypothetical protein